MPRRGKFLYANDMEQGAIFDALQDPRDRVRINPDVDPATEHQHLVRMIDIVGSAIS